MKKKVIVVGANGQLGRCIQDLVEEYLNFEFYFFSSKELDITLKKEVLDVFAQNNFDYCINCAAYTAVDKAELEQEKAFEVNVKGVENIAKVCKRNNVKLIHISTDFVFDGKANKPYTEECASNPVSVYGHTKLEGENKIINNLKHFMIIRTSWLYSAYSENFVNKMLNLAKTNKEISVVSDQIGSPTSAKDLAKTILTILDSGFNKYGIYNYSNDGTASWFDFAQAVFLFREIKTKVSPIKSEEFKTIAKRPAYSVLNCSKIKTDYDIIGQNWKQSLRKVLDQNKNHDN